MFKLTVEGSSLSELKTSLAAVLAALDAGAPAKTATKADKPPAEEKKTPPPADDEPAGLDYETDVKPLVIKISKDHGREAAAAVLGKFENAEGEPCAKGQEVQPADYPELVKKIKAAQKKLDAAKEAAEDE